MNRRPKRQSESLMLVDYLIGVSRWALFPRLRGRGDVCSIMTVIFNKITRKTPRSIVRREKMLV